MVEQLNMPVSAEELAERKEARDKAAVKLSAWLDAFEATNLKQLLGNAEVPASFKTKAKEAQATIEAYDSLHEKAKSSAIGNYELSSLLNKEDVRDIFNKAAEKYSDYETELTSLLETQARDTSRFLTGMLTDICESAGIDPKYLHGMAVPGFGAIVVNGKLAVVPAPVSREHKRGRVSWARGALREVFEAETGEAPVAVAAGKAESEEAGE